MTKKSSESEKRKMVRRGRTSQKIRNMQRQYPFFPGFYQSPAMYPTWSNSWETSKKREEKEYDSSSENFIDYIIFV